MAAACLSIRATTAFSSPLVSARSTWRSERAARTWSWKSFSLTLGLLGSIWVEMKTLQEPQQHEETVLPTFEMADGTSEIKKQASEFRKKTAELEAALLAFQQTLTIPQIQAAIIETLATMPVHKRLCCDCGRPITDHELKEVAFDIEDVARQPHYLVTHGPISCAYDNGWQRGLKEGKAHGARMERDSARRKAQKRADKAAKKVA